MNNWQLVLKIHVIVLIDSASSVMYKHRTILFLSITDTSSAAQVPTPSGCRLGEGEKINLPNRGIFICSASFPSRVSYL
jgi:hypothetical protein